MLNKNRTGFAWWVIALALAWAVVAGGGTLLFISKQFDKVATVCP